MTDWANSYIPDLKTQEEPLYIEQSKIYTAESNGDAELMCYTQKKMSSVTLPQCQAVSIATAAAMMITMMLKICASVKRVSCLWSPYQRVLFKCWNHAITLHN